MYIPFGATRIIDAEKAALPLNFQVC